MSKLLEETHTENNTAALLPLSNSVVIAHLKASQKQTAKTAGMYFGKFLGAYETAIEREIKDAESNQEAMDLSSFLNLLRDNHDDISRYFCGYVSEGFVKFKKRELNTTVGSKGGGSDDQLSLVGNEDLEETISITSLTQRVDAYFAEPLWALNQRFAVLNGGEHVTEASNPTAPIQFCESLRKTLKYLDLTTKLKTLAYKVFDKQLVDLTRIVTEEVNQYLKSKGILPHLRYVLPTGTAPQSLLFDSGQSGSDVDGVDRSESGHSETVGVDQNLPPEQYQTELLGAIKSLQNQLFMANVNTTPSRVAISEAELIGAIQNLQLQVQSASDIFASDRPLVPLDISSVIQQLKSMVSSEEAREFETAEMQTIDLVGMLFEYMLNDENLPDRVKALLSYLHTPFLKIAFADADFFEKTDHPARLLLNSLAEAGARWVGNDGTQQYDIYEKIKYVVDRILKEFDSDIKVITSLLMEFNSHTKNIVRRQELMEKRATEKAQGEEKLREVKLRVNDEIRKRTDNQELPSALLLFLLQPWSDYLSFALLRYGEQSEKWNKAVSLMDDLLWGIRPKTSETDKANQLGMQEDILSRIKFGFDTIGFDQTKGKKLIDALTSLMKLAMQSKKAEPAPAPMRHKLEKIAAEKAGSPPANDDAASDEEASVLEKLKVIEFGTWFEFDGGKRLKIAWYNGRTSHYMLVDQMGKRVDMMSGLEMARQMINGTAKIISGSSKPFFERALENIYQKLNEKASASKKTEPLDDPDHV